MKTQPTSASMLVRKAGCAAAIATAATTAAFAGIVAPGGDAHIWSGAINSNWHIAGNWTNGQVPAAGDAAIINGSPVNINLNADSASLASLFLSGGIGLSNNSHRLNVNNGDAVMTVTGVNTNFFVNGVGLGALIDTLDLESSGRLVMGGGHARINTRLTMTGNARVSGQGLIEVMSPNVAAFSGLGGQLIQANNGELMISMVNGGSVVLPPVANVFGDGASLIVDGPMFAAVNTVNLLSENTEFAILEEWTLNGSFNSGTGQGEVGRISGGEMNVNGLIHVMSGDLIIESEVNFSATSDIQIDAFSSLTIEDAHTSVAGHLTDVERGGALRINGTQGIGPTWNGDIQLLAATLEVNQPQIAWWRLGGDLSTSTHNGERSRLAGDATIYMTGDVTVAGFGLDIDTTLDLRNGSSMTLDHPSTVVTVNGSLIQRATADISGPGTIEIAQTGSFITTDPADLDVDIVNAGAFGVQRATSVTGYTHVNASYEQTSNGRLEVQIIGGTPFDVDTYEFTESVTLAGELNVVLGGGYVPMVGDEFVIVIGSGGVSGSFDILTGDAGFEASVVGNQVILTYVGAAQCAADLNGDGFVNGGDLAGLLAAWGSNDVAADLNGDGLVNGADLGNLLANWGECDETRPRTDSR